jgi:RNA polymerase sigma-70 factor (ECF subfamily)
MPSHTFTEQALVTQRPVLFRYALLQVLDSELADDLVQETLLSALQSKADYQGKSGLRTWLVGILKHKIADHWRRNARETVAPVVNQVGEDDGEIEEDDFFMSNGHWNAGLQAWADPEAALKQQEFWAIYEACQNNLPPKMAKVFMLRELVGLEAYAKKTLTIPTKKSLWVTTARRLRAAIL